MLQRLQDTRGKICMIDRIKEAFENGKAFIPFITSGDPSLETTEQLVYAMDDAGADIIELGVPFSDPTAEGPVIQAANLRALSAGTTTDKIFSMIAKIRTMFDFNGCTDFKRTNQDDCKGCQRFCLLRFIAWRHRNQKRDQN